MNPSLKQASQILKLVDDKGMPSDQLQALFNSGLLSDLMDANFGQVNRDEFRKVLGLIPVEPKPAPVPQPILAHVTVVEVAGIGKFTAADHFKEDTSKKATVAIGWLGDNFKSHFLGKIEENVPATTLRVHCLTRDSLDKDIRAELTPETEETTLTCLWNLLSKQPRGQKGILLTDGRANVFYIKDARGNLWAVGAGWDSPDGRWRVHAPSVTDPRGWLEGDQVFSRKVG